MLRTDQLKLGVFPVSVVIGAACFILGTILLVINLTKAHRAEITAGEYTPTYAKLSHYGKSSPAPSVSDTAETAQMPTEEKEPATTETAESTEIAEGTENTEPVNTEENELKKEEAKKRFSLLMNDEEDKGE